MKEMNKMFCKEKSIKQLNEEFKKLSRPIKVHKGQLCGFLAEGE